MKKIPDNVQLLICASNQITNHSKVIEELIYNALDADATSIAIRINIQENTIQVIDNGCGVFSKDFYSIGQKYMTSKFVDLSTLKSIPNKYGFRGQALANILNVSKSVKIISRHEKSEVTWMKLFECGKEKQITICNTRPSKGTTVEVSGFLYNLNIRNKKKQLGELQTIKTILEHTSLVHCNISLSLRDDSKNDIIFKMHKNRDMYQTLSSLYNINKEDYQELQVEKNAYKVKGFIGKTEKQTDRHYIFLNGKFLTNSSKLHKIMNNNLSKQYKTQGVSKQKIKNINKDEENKLFKKCIPFYIVFIQCPYMDYYFSNSPKQTILEFKDWSQVTKLLEKIANFFKGDIQIKEDKKILKNNACDNAEDSNIRLEVRKIIEKILGSNSKKHGLNAMHNGVEGKQVKRKSRKAVKPPQEKVAKKRNNNVKVNNSIQNRSKEDKVYNCKDIYTPPQIKRKHNINQTKKQGAKICSKPITKSCLETPIVKSYNTKLKSVSNSSKMTKNKIQSQKKNIKKANSSQNSHVSKVNIFSKLFEGVSLPKNKMNMYENNEPRPQHLIKPKALNDKCIQTSNACNKVNNKEFQSNYDLLQTILNTQENAIKDNVVRQNVDVNVTNKSPLIMNQAIQKKSDFINIQNHIRREETTRKNTNKDHTEILATFQSHNYYAHKNVNIESNKYITPKDNNYQQTENNKSHDGRKRTRTFITKLSRDNFAMPNKSSKREILKKKKNKTVYSKSSIKRLFKQTSRLFDLKKEIMGNTKESSYTIEYTENNYNIPHGENKLTPMALDQMNIGRAFTETANHHISQMNHNFSVKTNTLTVSNIYNNNIHDERCNFYETYTIECTKEQIVNNEKLHKHSDTSVNNRNFIFISKSQEHDNQQISDPINVCETILNSKELLNKEFELSFNNIENYLEGSTDEVDLQRRFYISPHACNERVYVNEQNQIMELPNNNLHVQESLNHVSYHFDVPDENIEDVNNESVKASSVENLRQQNVATIKQNQEIVRNPDNANNFNLKNRPCFVPKGLSPIFENCHKKNTCAYNLSADYYEDDLYNNFVDNVRNNAEIFEPNVPKANDATTKAIDKVNNRLNKEQSSLKFNGQSLKDAKVLGQVDEKFIATIMQECCNKETKTDYLVLFDQHAVHERIRLEKNLSEYITENRWKPVEIDAVTLKMNNDDILNLHNYVDKFEQLGLQWTVLNSNEISIVSIPEAILGKNPRQVEKVIQAVKNLITEEINIIKMQAGCVSLYPKSIMDLVFSEACRYAIMFGDKLSKSECAELLSMLSECKTPFQCAHGRPVMAVITDIKGSVVDYKVNIDKVKKWKEMRQHN